MKAAGQEIELRLTLAAGPALEEARALVEGAPPKSLTSVYYDTHDQRVRAEGYALRVRERDGRHLQTLKAAGGGLRRSETERATTGAGLDLEALAEGPLGRALEGAALAPVFTTYVSRRSKLVPIQESLIEVSLDEGRISSAGRSAPILELELELKSGDPAALYDLGKSLAAKAAMSLGLQSKSDRGYALASGELNLPTKFNAPDLSPDMSAGEAFAATARACLAHLELNAALLARGGPPEAAHQARVALRRLRVAFTVFKGFFPKDEANRLLEDQRWLTRELEPARNLDVFKLETLTPAQAAGAPGLTPLAFALETATDEAYRRAETACRSSRYRLFLLDAARFIELEPWTRDEAAAKKARRSCLHALRRIMNKRWRALRAKAAKVDWKDPKTRHALRIEAKRLRYSADIFASLARGEAKKRLSRFLSALERLQDSLGALNDIQVAKEVISLLVLGQEGGPRASEAGSAGAGALDLRRAEAEAELRSAKRAAHILLKTPIWW